MRLLFDLLALLPPMPDWKPPVRPRDPDRQPQPDWWDDYAKGHNPGWGGRYYRDSLKGSMLRVLRPDRDPGGDQEGIRRLAEYCLLFFSDFDNDQICKMLDVVAENYDALPEGAVGRRWARSVCETAWRLWVPREAARRRARPEQADASSTE